MNYRSAVVFGRGTVLADHEKLAALERFTNKLVPGRWQDARRPSVQELKATSVIAVTIESASAKVREGDPKDDDDDYALDVWAGIIPLHVHKAEAVADSRLRADVELPDYLKTLIQ
jgi:hypothetical protein